MRDDGGRYVSVDDEKQQSCQPDEDECVPSLKLKIVRWCQPKALSWKQDNERETEKSTETVTSPGHGKRS